MDREDSSIKGSKAHSYWVRRRDGQSEYTPGAVIDEIVLDIFVNGQELATLMTSPTDTEALALGFLYNEGIIKGVDEIASLRLHPLNHMVDVFLKTAVFEVPRRIILTSGCSAGITFQDLTTARPPLQSNLRLPGERLFAHMDYLQDNAMLYNHVRGVHTSILVTAHGEHILAEDVGRHNTIDKLTGKALLQGLDTQQALLLTTGRISSEMMTKAHHLEVPIVASRTSPTSISVEMAEAWNICLIGYLRKNAMRIYTHPERII